MAGIGPPPKREAQRRRQNKPQRPVEHVQGAVAAPDLDLPDAHPLAVSVYEALKASVEADYLTAAAWQRARVSVHVLSRQLNEDRMSPTMYAALQQDWKALLIDPAELRRLGIEVDRRPKVDEDELAATASLDEYRAARTG